MAAPCQVEYRQPTGHGQTSPEADDIAALLGKRDEGPAIGLDLDPVESHWGAAHRLRARWPLKFHAATPVTLIPPHWASFKKE